MCCIVSHSTLTGPLLDINLFLFIFTPVWLLYSSLSQFYCKLINPTPTGLQIIAHSPIVFLSKMYFASFSIEFIPNATLTAWCCHYELHIWNRVCGAILIVQVCSHHITESFCRLSFMCSWVHFVWLCHFSRIDTILNLTLFKAFDFDEPGI